MPISGSPWTAISRLAPKQSCWPCVSCGFRRPARFAANCGSAVSVLLHTSSRVMVHDCTIDVADRISTVSQGLLYCAYGIFCFLINQNLRRTRQVRTLAIILSVYGFVVAAFALIQSISSNGKLYWLRIPQQGGWIYGPYVNHNHYAGLMEMLVPIPLVFCLTRFARGPRKTMAAVSAALMASTIFLSGSRGGMVAFSVQMAILASL